MKKCACKDGQRCPRHLLGDVVFALEKEIESYKADLERDLQRFRSSNKPEAVLVGLGYVHGLVVRASKMTVNKYAIKKIKATLADKKVPESDKIAAVKTSIENIVRSSASFGYTRSTGVLDAVLDAERNAAWACVLERVDVEVRL
jgi:hypothetical protein